MSMYLWAQGIVFTFLSEAISHTVSQAMYVRTVSLLAKADFLSRARKVVLGDERYWVYRLPRTVIDF